MVVIDQSKKVVGRGQAAGILVPIYGWQEAVNNLYLAINTALSRKKLQNLPNCLAMAGVNISKDNHDWQLAIKNHPFLLSTISKPWIANDTLAALRSGTTDKNAIVIIAGTGSNCFGRNEKNQEARCGDAGHILGDDGSAYNIGLSILRNIVRALDGRGPDTILKDLLFEKFQLGSLEDLVDLVYEKPWNKVDIAQIAPLAKVAVDKDDKIAIQIIQKATDDLEEMIKAVVTKLDLVQKPYTIVTAGSVFKIQKILRARLEKEVKKITPNVKFVKPSMSSAEAAASLAFEGKF